MFDIGFPELMVVSIVALLILGPERLPEALRTLGLWMGRLRRSFTAVKTELEKELGMDDIRRQLHNESVMEEMQRIEAEVQNSLDVDAASASASASASGQDSAAENSIAPPPIKPTTDTPTTDAPTTDAPTTNEKSSNTTQAPNNHPADVTNDRANDS